MQKRNMKSINKWLAQILNLMAKVTVHEAVEYIACIFVRDDATASCTCLSNKIKFMKINELSYAKIISQKSCEPLGI
jgi:hypothetical protein